MKREKQQQMQQTAPATALPELDLDMSSSDDESSEEGDDGGQRKAEKDVHRLLDDIDAELEDPPSPAKPPADAEVQPLTRVFGRGLMLYILSSVKNVLNALDSLWCI